MTDPAALAARIEAATAETQGEVLREVLLAAWQCVWITHDAYHRACAMLRAGAYESAALVLVPDGWIWTMWAAIPTETAQWASTANVYYRREAAWQGEAATPALAILLACARARAAKEATNAE